jgi:Asp-tRNA(Asn)/Glu-tRNA(Gln) amidotransferase A subunit family amidase
MNHDVAWLSARELTRLVEEGELDRDLPARRHLERIRRYNPDLAAYVHVGEPSPAGEGPLAGVTLAVKDTYPVRGMPWTYGSPKWRDRVADEDALQVRWARAAGAVVMGKTNLPELAASIGTSNEIFPPTQNPWRRGFTPGGSSGGSAAAVAAGLATIAFGDDMGGSIRIPSACCGVAGLRPSLGTVPTEEPDPTRLSVRGPLARWAGDLRLALDVMAGRPHLSTGPAAGPRRHLRLAVVRETPLAVDPAGQDVCERAASRLEAAGHQLASISWDPLSVARSYQVVRPASVSTMPGEPGEYGASAGRLIARGREIKAQQLLSALESGLAAAQVLHEVLRDYDAILTPALGRRPMPIPEVPAFLSEDWLGYTQFMLPVSYAGLPAVCLPAGVNEGLPVGVQLIGRFQGESELLDLAEELEAQPGFGFQTPPGFD